MKGKGERGEGKRVQKKGVEGKGGVERGDKGYESKERNKRNEKAKSY